VDFNSDDNTFIANIDNVGRNLDLTPDQVRVYYEKRLKEYKNSLHKLEGVDAAKKQEILNLIDTRLMRLNLKGGTSSDNPPVTFRDVTDTFGSTQTTPIVQPVGDTSAILSAAGYSSRYMNSSGSHSKSHRSRKSFY
jgi:hypothetical protein